MELILLWRKDKPTLANMIKEANELAEFDGFEKRLAENSVIGEVFRFVKEMYGEI